MMYFIFLVAALITILAAIKLSTYADVIGKRTSLGGMMVGILLLAGATSLPEVTTSLTAIVIHNQDIAVSNIFGSNLFNLFIIAIFDLYFRKKKILTYIEQRHLTTGIISFGLSMIVFIAMLYPSGIHFMNVGIEMFLLVVFYVIGIKLVSSQASQLSANEAAITVENTYHTKAVSLKEAKVGFTIAALVILASGSVLTISGDAIAISTGLSSSFIGTFLIAGATSLPEMVTVLVAIQLANYNLAVGNIIGSNIFNLLILVFIDLLYREGPILAAIHPVTLLTSFTVLLLSIFIIGGILLTRSKRFSEHLYPIPSLILVIIYLLSSYFIFTFS